jgi:hypothetical protein
MGRAVWEGMKTRTPRQVLAALVADYERSSVAAELERLLAGFPSESPAVRRVRAQAARPVCWQRMVAS